jgi:thiol-disulfide isomerase/thioredoxin
MGEIVKKTNPASVVPRVENFAHPPAPIGVIAIDDQKHKEQIISSNHVVVVDIYADWCGPCKNFAPQYVQMASEYGNRVIFAKENVDLGLTKVGGVPAFQFYVGGALKTEFSGADVKRIRETLQQFL